jgi:hypothetical protein
VQVPTASSAAANVKPGIIVMGSASAANAEPVVVATISILMQCRSGTQAARPPTSRTSCPSRQPELLPVNQGGVANGNKILLQFPTDSVFDFISFLFDATIQTCHGGNQSENVANNYTQTYYIPRNGIASMISQMDIRVKGRSNQNMYTMLYQIGFITVKICLMKLVELLILH